MTLPSFKLIIRDRVWQTKKSAALTAGPGRRADFGKTTSDGDLMNKMLRRLLELERLEGEKYGSAGSVYFVAAYSCDLAPQEDPPGGLGSYGISR